MKLEEEFDLIHVIKKLYNKKKAILIFSFLFSILGVFYSFLSNDIYISKIDVLPENQISELSPLESIANISGFSKDNNNTISPLLYSDILKSYPYKKELINIIIDDTIKVQDLFKNSSNNSFNINPISILNSIYSKIIVNKKSKENSQYKILPENFYISRSDEKIYKKIDNILSIKIDSEKGIFTLSCSYNDPIYSAKILIEAYNLLERYIIDFKTKKSKENYNFILNNYLSKKQEFNEIQLKLNSFADKNKNISTNIFSGEYSNLENEFNIIKSSFTELAIQLEKSKIKLNSDKPVFSIINHAKVSNKSLKPGKVNSLILFFFIGVILSSIYFTLINSVMLIVNKILY